jgi:hypothetical protein
MARAVRSDGYANRSLAWPSGLGHRRCARKGAELRSANGNCQKAATKVVILMKLRRRLIGRIVGFGLEDRCSNHRVAAKPKFKIKRRVKISFDDAVKLILEEDDALLRRLAD